MIKNSNSKYRSIHLYNPKKEGLGSYDLKYINAYKKDKYIKNIPTKDGHIGESLDNTANIKDILSLGWRPKRDLDKYLKGKIHGHTKFKEYIKRILPKKFR